MTIFRTPEPDLEDVQVLEQIHAYRSELADVMRVPRRWAGGLRRSMLARAIQGSNSIEGYEVRVDDAVAALDDEESLSADEQTFAEIRGYRQALGYVLAMAGDADFALDVAAVRAMHFMMLEPRPVEESGQLPAAGDLRPRREDRRERLRRTAGGQTSPGLSKS